LGPVTTRALEPLQGNKLMASTVCHEKLANTKIFPLYQFPFMSSSINLQAPPTSSSPWRRHSAAYLPKVLRFIPLPKSGSFWRKILAFAGPGFLASVGYYGPGNWATGFAGGAQFGYDLLSVISHLDGDSPPTSLHQTRGGTRRVGIITHRLLRFVSAVWEFYQD